MTGTREASRVQSTQLELKLPSTQAEGQMMRVENDPGLERVTFDSVWRLLPQATQVQTTCPESLGIPFLLTLVHEWLLPGF